MVELMGQGNNRDQENAVLMTLRPQRLNGELPFLADWLDCYFLFYLQKIISIGSEGDRNDRPLDSRLQRKRYRPTIHPEYFYLSLFTSTRQM